MVLVIIDVQKLITNDKLYNFEEFLINLECLIKVARENNVEIIYIRHDDGKASKLTRGNLAFEIYDKFQPKAKEKIFDKKVNSIFKDSGLLEYLKDKKEKELIIAGLQTDFCIDASIKAAFEYGFEVIVPAYANTTIDNSYMKGEKTYKYYNEYIWPNRYAKCISMEKVLEYMRSERRGFI